MYGGLHILTLDEKGRLSLPAKMCEELKLKDNPLVVLLDGFGDGCLWLCYQKKWPEIEAAMSSLNQSQAQNRMVRRRISTQMEVAIDGSNRLLIPMQFRLLTKMKKRIVVSGESQRLELWAYEQYEKICPLSQEIPQDLNDDINNLPI